MNNGKDYTRLNKKLKELKKMIMSLDSHAMELINISAKVEMKLRKMELTDNEIAGYEARIDKLIKEVKK
ncbi:MAG: hypothetical protein KDC42_01445 [Ignavibacteriae bacterium]|nr:hypothetical protein [Ignavibacteriota bacterium]